MALGGVRPQRAGQREKLVFFRSRNRFHLEFIARSECVHDFLDDALKPHDVRWHWIKGHAGHDENERADQLAREGVAIARLK